MDLPADDDCKSVIALLLTELRSQEKTSVLINRLGIALRDAHPEITEVSRLHGIWNHVCRDFLLEAKDAIDQAICSFCQRPQEDVFWLVDGPLATICDDCIRLSDFYVAHAQLDKKTRLGKWWWRIWHRERLTYRGTASKGGKGT